MSYQAKHPWSIRKGLEKDTNSWDTVDQTASPPGWGRCAPPIPSQRLLGPRTLGNILHLICEGKFILWWSGWCESQLLNSWKFFQRPVILWSMPRPNFDSCIAIFITCSFLNPDSNCHDSDELGTSHQVIAPVSNYHFQTPALRWADRLQTHS